MGVIGAIAGLCLACERAPARRELVVLAAASLTDGFAALEPTFEAEHPELDVRFTFAGTQTLRAQIEHGARADVFAAASHDAMDPLVAAGLVTDSTVFVTNALVIAVPRDNPAGLRTLADLPHATRIVLGAEDVPVGQYARLLLERAEATLGPSRSRDPGAKTFRARVLEHVVSYEANVRLVLAKVELGEADAAIVYASDVVGREAIASIEIPEAANVIAEYPIGMLSAAAEPDGARRWIALVTDAASTGTFTRHGFGRPLGG